MMNEMESNENGKCHAMPLNGMEGGRACHEDEDQPG
jgi:hypothetical protein